MGTESFDEKYEELKRCPGSEFESQILQTIHNLEKKRSALEQQRQWYFATSDAGLEILKQVLDGSGMAIARRWAARLMAHYEDPEAKSRLESLRDRDRDVDVQVKAAWGLIRKERPQECTLRAANPDGVSLWLIKMGNRLNHNPFAVLAAEDLTGSREQQERAESYFVSIQAYEHLKSSGHVFVFGPPGSGKTSLRLQLQSLEQRQDTLVIEYTDFARWLDWGLVVSPSTAAHVEQILTCAADLLKGHISATIAPRSLPPCERLGRLTQLALASGYSGGVCITVDTGRTDRQAPYDLRLLGTVLRHLLDDAEILTIPELYFRFFVPDSLLDYIEHYTSLTRGLIPTIRIQWTEKELKGLLENRLLTASDQQLSALHPLVFDSEHQAPRSWDEALALKAGASPRRLIRMVDQLFQHRAAQWAQACPQTADTSGDQIIRLQPKDWATLLQSLIAPDARQVSESHARQV